MYLCRRSVPVIPSSASQSLCAIFAGLLPLHVLHYSASSPFPLHCGPYSFFSSLSGRSAQPMFPARIATFTRYFPFCPALFVMLPFSVISSFTTFNISDVLAAFLQKSVSALQHYCPYCIVITNVCALIIIYS